MGWSATSCAGTGASTSSRSRPSSRRSRLGSTSRRSSSCRAHGRRGARGLRRAAGEARTRRTADPGAAARAPRGRRPLRRRARRRGRARPRPARAAQQDRSRRRHPALGRDLGRRVVDHRRERARRQARRRRAAERLGERPYRDRDHRRPRAPPTASTSRSSPSWPRLPRARPTSYASPTATRFHSPCSRCCLPASRGGCRATSVRFAEVLVLATPCRAAHRGPGRVHRRHRPRGPQRHHRRGRRGPRAAGCEDGGVRQDQHAHARGAGLVAIRPEPGFEVRRAARARRVGRAVLLARARGVDDRRRDGAGAAARRGGRRRGGDERRGRADRRSRGGRRQVRLRRRARAGRHRDRAGGVGRGPSPVGGRYAGALLARDRLRDDAQATLGDSTGWACATR